ncbi:MAG: hypothetical protein GC157_08955 [Frankiales bacterium]|nr:hypothetical protein [Frankiales bacterium]
MKRIIATCAVTAGLVLSGTGVANAGEYTGNGGYPAATDHAASECAYSGLDRADSLEGNPPGFDDDALAVRGNQSPGGVDRYHGVQSYGIYVRAGLKALVPSPGVACNGSGG